jgi:riboflavin synthase
MFTGIVTDVGKVRAVQPDRAGTGVRLEIETPFVTNAVALGASICCSGCCLTVVDKGAGWFAADASAETLARTTIGEWRPGRRVNLERSLRVGDELGGHIVSGHVDGVGRIAGRRPDGESVRFTFAAGPALAPYIATKGSIAVDGISLTVNEIEDDSSGGCRFGVNIIPHTHAITTLGTAAAGDRVNLEIDPLARYVARWNSRS